MMMPLALPPVDHAPFDVVGLGQNSLDIVAVIDRHPASDTKHGVETLVKMPGGQIASALVACARQGWRARYVGRFGRDDHGDFVKRALIAEGVDVSAALSVKGDTHTSLILVNQTTGHRTAIWRHDPRVAMTADDVDVAAVTSGRVFVVDAQDVAASTLGAAAARRAGIPTVVDIDEPSTGTDALLREIDVLIAAETFPMAATGAASMGEALRRLAREYASAVVVVTLGSGGSLALCGGRETCVPAIPVSVVDATGAGDAFRGGFISTWLRLGAAATLEAILEGATVTAALKCCHLGAQTGLPTRVEFDDFVTGARDVLSNLSGMERSDAAGQ